MNKEKMKQECLARLKMLDIFKPTIKEFEKEDKVNFSTGMGCLYWVNEELQEVINEFETKHNAMVYHLIHSNTEFGELYALLYVSQYENEWEMDKVDIKNNIAFAYVYNVDEPNFSEFGTIGIQQFGGGLIRTY